MTLCRAAATMVLLIGTAAPAQPEPSAASVSGWWRASPTYRGDSEDFYLHFDDKGPKPAASFSIPAITADRSPIGPYAIEKANISFPAVQWSLSLDDGGESLVGILPSALVPAYQLGVRFRRSPPPPAVPEVKPVADPPARLWQSNVGGSVFGGVAHDPARKQILLGTDAGTVVALDASSGARRWSTRIGSPVHSAPVAAAGAIYVASDAGVAKLRARDGRILWQRAFEGTIPARLSIKDPASRWDHYGSSAVLAGNLVVAGSRDGCVYALAERDGQLARRICSKDMITGTPAVAGNRVYFGSFDNHVYAADLRGGAVLWKRDLKGPVPRDLTLDGSNVVAGSRSYDLAALDTRTGEPAWTAYNWFSWIDSTAAVDGDRLFIGSSDSQRLFMRDARNGRAERTTFLGGWVWARPAPTPTTIYAGVVGTNLKYVGVRKGGLAAVDRETGSIRWIFRPPKNGDAVIYGFAAAPLVAAGRLFAADVAGNVYAFRT